MRTLTNKSGFALTSLSAIILSAALTGCLSGSGSSGSDAPPVDPLTISTQQGDFSGINLNGVRVFRGIPYAQPPVNDLRFSAPLPAESHDGVVALSEEFGNMCPQSDINTGAVQGDEDCLFLNVYAPEQAAGLPVMVWIHGGAFVFGNGGGEYDPTRLVEEDVIVVTLNYRLGHLGFLAHPELGDGDGNFGLMDQQLALQWVKDNIAAFGGDPDTVTIFGESAGGHSVMSHIVSPSAQENDLFQRAIIQSGSYAQDQVPLAQGQQIGLGVEGAARATFADVCAEQTAADCLRALTPTQVLALQGSQSIPTAGGNFLPRSIAQGLSSGQIDNNLDIMIGNNQDEGTLFVALDELTNNLTSLDAMGIGEYRNRVADFFAPYLAVVPFDVEQIGDDYLARYTGNPSQLSLALSAIWTDFMFACNSQAQAGLFAGQNMNTYQYWFRDTNAPWTLVPPAVPVPNVGNVPISFPLGATHAGEIPYVLYPESIMQDRYTGNEAELDDLAANMVTFWTQFAKYGDPNASDGATLEWPQVSSGEIMQLDTPQLETVSASEFAGYHYCGYWANPPLTL
ncbi:carboxylesterase/lipase family protein [Halopseudomonas salegens]|uniref:Carboxylic ester hydrolase n=1 Tax=Halopseudomonas salegens TaxID=1434072 RepID=A0A1H2FIU3_9GAMM|nr:carboxylesterase family protein [Halopseudomonas salegens]SDU07199.1 para-nitrobenzyl esterase [Halopseudomonas salegens]